jgi:hypothetical protein
MMPLDPGQCAPVQCDWPNPPAPEAGTDLWFRADDDGTNKPPAVPECKNGNDMLFIPKAVCTKVG